MLVSRQKTDVPAKLDCQIVKAALRSKETRMDRSYCKYVLIHDVVSRQRWDRNSEQDETGCVR